MSHFKHFMLLIALTASGVGGATANAQDGDTAPTLNSAIEKMGDEIARYVKAQQDDSAQVAVGTFVGPGPQSSNAGARIVVALRNHLEKDMRIGDTGTYSIAGEFRGEKMDGQFVTVIEASIKDTLGTTLHRLRKKIITDEEEGVAFFGPTSLDLTTTAGTTLVSTGETKTTAIVDSIVKPKVHLSSNIIQTSSTSPYGIELLLKTDSGYKSMPVKNESGLAKVGFGKDQIYAVRLHNKSRKPIGVKLTIDGVNVFAMSTKAAYRGKDITMALCPCSTSRIKGWHLTDLESAEFQVSKFGETAAATLGAFENMGTITARFFDATPKGPLNCAPCERTRGLGTKLGAKTKMNYGSLDVKFGELLGSVSVRYTKEELPTDLPPQ